LFDFFFHSRRDVEVFTYVVWYIACELIFLPCFLSLGCLFVCAQQNIVNRKDMR
jgi:hypothetical protein